MMKTFPLKSTNMIESLKTIKMETETYGTNPKETFPFESSFKVETYPIDSTNKIQTFPIVSTDENDPWKTNKMETLPYGINKMDPFLLDQAKKLKPFLLFQLMKMDLGKQTKWKLHHLEQTKWKLLLSTQ